MNNAARILVAVVVILGLAMTTYGQERPAAKAGWDADWFQRAVSGSWTGTGIVYGNNVSLTREWALDLGGQFLRADMNVEMGGRGSFRVVAYWRLVAPGRYEITWMDELGESQAFDAVASSDAKEIRVYAADTDDSGAPEWRRTVYRIVSDDEYVELMFRETTQRWEKIAEFRFTRAAS